ncbi:energy transducer TonB [Erythrobacter sp. HKB08]|uniref:energy transducer TonB n=1 Tax=Erythrobacter sp. HKB08 TaxID=2502843 RepID=UPI001008E9E2|nr:energy transducer TonB [Erythrobacter sp. HKB08]
MAYVDQNTSNGRITAIAGVIAIHAAIGGILITGLSTVMPYITEEKPLPATEFELDPPPPEQEIEPEQVETQTPQAPDIYTPEPPVSIPTAPPDLGTTVELPPLGPILEKVPPRGDTFVKPTPKPEPTFDPLPAKPSNNPGGWVTTADYKSSWITRELQGTVGFEVRVGANGRVETCRVTSSSGHSQLDDATCRLIERRARFSAARDSKGIKSPGTYRNAVRWQLPD